MRVVQYGGGVNSTALIVGLINKGIKVDLILFADTGGEQKGTYQYIESFSKWIQEKGQPSIIIVKKVDKYSNVMTLEEECILNEYLPSIAYGFKKCSQKYKIQPSEKFANHYTPAKECWKRGEKIIRYIGYDLDEQRRVKYLEDAKYINEFPLIEWQWNRARCIEVIKEAGLNVPPKSSCFFCPNMKKHEILALPKDLQKRAMDIEDNAQHKLIELKGLGRRFAWRDLIEARKKSEEMEDLEMYQLPCECLD